MNRITSNYHTLHVLKSAQIKLRIAIISNCDKKLVNCISECVLNVLNCSNALTECDTRKLRKHKVALCNIADTHVSLAGKKRLIVQRAWYFLQLQPAVLPTLARLIVK